MRIARHVTVALQNWLAGEIGPELDDVSPAKYGSRQRGYQTTLKVHPMLYTIAIVLLILWLLGLVTSYTLGGFIHILLVVALVVVLINFISGRRQL